MSKQLKLAAPDALPLASWSLLASVTDRLHLKAAEEIASLRGRQVILNLRNTGARPVASWHPDLELPLRRFAVASRVSTVVGIDSSCIPVAEAEDGSIYAAKACAVFCRGGATESYLRLGPLLFYLRESNVLDVFGSRAEARRLAKFILFDSAVAQRLIRRRLEQAMALELADTEDAAVVLLDGALRRSVLDAPHAGLDQVLAHARSHGNVVIGISKSTRLKILSRLMGLFDRAPSAPVYADVHDVVAPLSGGLLGRVLLIRFTERGHVFRADVGSGDTFSLEEVLSRVRFNDVFHEGYPESLRLAHHLSVFSCADDASIKCLLAGRLGAVEVVAEDTRRAVLGTLRVRGSGRRG